VGLLKASADAKHTGMKSLSVPHEEGGNPHTMRSDFS
jgi:hypothetical protein